MSFVHLHVHSGYSMDSVVKIDELVKAVRDMNMPAVALTDHGQMFGLMEFYRAAQRAGVKPILGVETYVAADRHHRGIDDLGHHLVLLAENMEGYRNLCRLVSLANIEGLFYQPQNDRISPAYPRVDKELLATHNQGLIALSACLQGEIPALLLEGRFEAAKSVAEDYARLFPGRFYLEVHNHGLPAQAVVMVGLVEIGRDLGLPLAAANDVHYLQKEQSELHDILLCSQQYLTLADEQRFRFPSQEYYFKSASEMAAAFPHLPETLANTLEIADRCHVEFPYARRQVAPPFPAEKLHGRSEAEQLKKLARAGLKRRLAAKKDQKLPLAAGKNAYRNRLKEELAVIIEKGWSGYFLIVADYVNWAKTNDVTVGPGRGPAAGSLVNYALAITEVDPLRFDLLFERFLNRESFSEPDMAVDFCAAQREDVIRYVRETYGGPERVAGIIEWWCYHLWGALDTTGHVLLGDEEMDWLTDLMFYSHLEGGEDIPQELIQAAKDNPGVAKLLACAVELENLSLHFYDAKALVISDRLEYLPLIRLPAEGLCCYEKPETPEADKQNFELGSQYELKGVKELGFATFNFMALKVLTVVGHSQIFLREQGLLEVDLQNLSFDDTPTWALLARGETDGVFQLENAGHSEYLVDPKRLAALRPDRFKRESADFREYLVKLKPNCLEDLMAFVALYRPGPIKAGLIDLFIDRKQGCGQAVYDPPQLEPVLKDTYGVIIYQEQIIRASHILAGFSPAKADHMRRDLLLMKHSEIIQWRSRFIAGAKAHGLKGAEARHFFARLVRAAPDCACKAHSAAYAILTYQTAWLKANHPEAFEMARLTIKEMRA